MLKIHFSDRFSVGLAVLGLGEHVHGVILLGHLEP